ncbi:hypothetical protein KM043_006758 [Ampulex compressa]|nr:hypothetical protein KM043_006758 [Ampulex compressa]
MVPPAVVAGVCQAEVNQEGLSRKLLALVRLCTDITKSGWAGGRRRQRQRQPGGTVRGHRSLSLVQTRSHGMACCLNGARTVTAVGHTLNPRERLENGRDVQ